MEGADSLNVSIGAMALATTDTFPTLLSPFSVGCWVKPAGTYSTGGDGNGAFVMHHYDDRGHAGHVADAPLGRRLRARREEC